MVSLGVAQVGEGQIEVRVKHAMQTNLIARDQGQPVLSRRRTMKPRTKKPTAQQHHQEGHPTIRPLSQNRLPALVVVPGRAEDETLGDRRRVTRLPNLKELQRSSR